jgi:nucleoside-diphosphate-sugar epimerase
MPTLITGAGQVGSYVAARLVEMGERPVLFDVSPPVAATAEVVALDRVGIVKGDLLDLADLLHALKDEKIDAIIHTAAMLPTPDATPHKTVKVNILGTLNVLEAARILNLRRVVHVSSTVVYYGAFGKEAAQPVVNEEFPTGRFGGFFYGTTKMASEWIVLDYADACGLDVVACRLGHIWGAWGGRLAAPISFLLERLVQDPLRGKPAVIDDPILMWAGKEGTAHVKNVAQGLVLARDSQALRHRVFNILDERAHGFDEFVDGVKRLLPQAQISVTVKTQGGYSGTPSAPQRPFSIERAKSELGYKPEYDLERGLKEYFEWAKRKISR